MWLRNRFQPGLEHGVTEILGDQVFHHIAGYLAGEAVPHHAGRDLAFAEPRYPRLLGILLHQRFLLLAYHVRGDLNAQLALAGRVHRRDVRAMGVVMPFVGVCR